MKKAEELFPYLPNEENDIATREWNQRMYDKREAYNLALSSFETFEDAARPLIKWMCENKHPHVTAIVTPTNAELMEGQISTGQIMDYVRD